MSEAEAQKQPTNKRTRKTPEQQLAEAEERVRKLKREIAERERKARTRRLIKSAATIESVSGVELDETIARGLGKILKRDAERPDSTTARYIAERERKAASDKSDDDHPGQG